MPSRVQRTSVAALCAGWLLAASLAGCGGISQARVPNLSVPARPTSFRALGYSSAGISLLAPANWFVAGDQSAPLLTLATSGPATIALWNYPRNGGAIPATATATLDTARTALLTAIRYRDPGFRLFASALTSVEGVGAIELDGVETIDGRVRRARSEHVYTSGAEIVLDEYAPVRLFKTVDHYVFSPVRKSLHLLASAR